MAPWKTITPGDPFPALRGAVGQYASCRERCQSPAGRAFLFLAQTYGLSRTDLRQPEIVLHLAVDAVRLLSPHAYDHDAVLARLQTDQASLQAFCERVLDPETTGWWFAPVDRTAQEWISLTGQPPTAEQFIVPEGPLPAFSRYAQKPVGGLFTSTAVGITSGALALLADGYGDYQATLPLVRYRLTIAPGARVFEVTGPSAWHDLCATYPAPGDHGRLVPDWSAIAHDWDGVYLTLGGLLTAEQVRVSTPAGWTEHAAWDTEQTAWLRWSFARIERLPDFAQLPHPLSR